MGRPSTEWRSKHIYLRASDRAVRAIQERIEHARRLYGNKAATVLAVQALRTIDKTLLSARERVEKQQQENTDNGRRTG